MNVLVTGGAGYIGSHTVRALLDHGDSVVVLDERPSRAGATLEAAHWVQGDIADTTLVRRLLVDHAVDGVIHFAAYKSVAGSMREPERYFRNNVAGTISVLEAMALSSTRSLVFSSTCAVYGTPERCPVDESTPIHPESPYGASKALIEQMLPWFSTIHRLRWVSLRYFNAAGASLDAKLGEDWDESTMLIPALMKAALGRREPVDIFGTDYPTPDGTAIRDFVHVLDLAEAHLQALEYVARDGESRVLNLGTGTGSSVLEVLEMARRVTGREVPVTFVGRRAGDAAVIWADATRARELLGWRPRYGLTEIVDSAWRWHSSGVQG